MIDVLYMKVCKYWAVINLGVESRQEYTVYWFILPFNKDLVFYCIFDAISQYFQHRLNWKVKETVKESLEVVIEDDSPPHPSLEERTGFRE